MGTPHANTLRSAPLGASTKGAGPEHEEGGPAHELEFLDIELTERCNNNCVHCYINLPAGDKEAIRREMPFRLLRRILTDARDSGCSVVRFTGGEPLLRRDFGKIYRFAADAQVKISITTNATLMTDRIADLFLETPPSAVTVSFYGWDRQSYEKTTRTPGSFDGFLRGIALLQRCSVPFKPNMPAVPWLVRNQASVDVFARSLGAQSDTPFVWDLSLRARRDPEKSRQIQRLRLCPEDAATLILSDPQRSAHIAEVIRAVKPLPKPRTRLFACRAGKNRLTVNAYGQLQVCLEMRHPDTVYDLKCGSLGRALKTFTSEVRSFQAASEVYLNRCSRCLLRRICGQCPACSWMESMTLDTPVDYYCRVTHEVTRRLGFLGSDQWGWSVPRLHGEAQHQPGAEQSAPPDTA